MKTTAFAMTSVLAAVCTATFAFGQWSLPFALAPVTVGQDKKVTIDFDNAPVSQVFDWLKKAGINFVVETTDIPKSKRLTVHVKGQSREQAVQAIASALGMSATKKGDIYSLRGGTWTSFSPDSKTYNWTPQEAEKWSKEFGKDFGSDWQMKGMDDKAWQEMSKNFAEDWKFKGLDEKAWKDMAKDWEKMSKDSTKWKDIPPGKSFEWKEMPDLEKHMQELSKLKEMPFNEHLKDIVQEGHLKEMKGAEIEKMVQEHIKEMKLGEHLSELQKDGMLKEMKSAELQKMLGEHMKELSKLKEMPEVDMKLKERMQELSKDGRFKEMQSEELKKALSEHMQELGKMKELQHGEIEKAMAEHRKAMGQLKEMPDIEKLIKERMKEMPNLEKMHLEMKDLPKVKADAMKAHLEAMKELKNIKMPDMTKLNAQLANLKKLVNSLTPAQLEKNKSQGYLKVSDLTPEQQKLLGDFAKDGDMTMQFDKDGTKIRIKR